MSRDAAIPFLLTTLEGCGCDKAADCHRPLTDQAAAEAEAFGLLAKHWPSLWD